MTTLKSTLAFRKEQVVRFTGHKNSIEKTSDFLAAVKAYFKTFRGDPNSTRTSVISSRSSCTEVQTPGCGFAGRNTRRQWLSLINQFYLLLAKQFYPIEVLNSNCPELNKYLDGSLNEIHIKFCELKSTTHQAHVYTDEKTILELDHIDYCNNALPCSAKPVGVEQQYSDFARCLQDSGRADRSSCRLSMSSCTPPRADSHQVPLQGRTHRPETVSTMNEIVINAQRQNTRSWWWSTNRKEEDKLDVDLDMICATASLQYTNLSLVDKKPKQNGMDLQLQEDRFAERFTPDSEKLEKAKRWKHIKGGTTDECEDYTEGRGSGPGSRGGDPAPGAPATYGRFGATRRNYLGEYTQRKGNHTWKTIFCGCGGCVHYRRDCGSPYKVTPTNRPTLAAQSTGHGGAGPGRGRITGITEIEVEPTHPMPERQPEHALLVSVYIMEADNGLWEYIDPNTDIDRTNHGSMRTGMGDMEDLERRWKRHPFPERLTRITV
ncbi:hypothetical protein BDK51DRAFT_43062 [Blyttiomyces helicus]|uniref:Uncharacterized protein n=1 Tax=Blyttiomyces helicus TaxID=388810 RepID=A0A4P9WHG6_9FUNG|nr:hypothetical protein BDK51DRAFT_43062 [Blyttiomyces helicus]|eukprot:RKO90858.1 hypothetical protein BDK51DRAFT_43062 [Blyttiomyces helicus]